jgi:hypothetical protein
MYQQQNSASINLFPAKALPNQSKTRTPQGTLSINHRLMEKYNPLKKQGSKKFSLARKDIQTNGVNGNLKKNRKKSLLREKIKSEKGGRRRSTFKREVGKQNQENRKVNGRCSFPKNGTLRKNKSRLLCWCYWKCNVNVKVPTPHTVRENRD